MEVRERPDLLTSKAGRKARVPRLNIQIDESTGSELVKPLTAGQTLVDKDIPSTTSLRSSNPVFRRAEMSA